MTSVLSSFQKFRFEKEDLVMWWWVIQSETVKPQIYLHGVVEELMFKLFDPKDLLKQIVELFFVEGLVPEHGCGWPLAWTALFLV